MDNVDYAAVFTPLATSVTDGLGDVLPVVLPIFGLVLVIGFAWKMTKKAAK